MGLDIGFELYDKEASKAKKALVSIDFKENDEEINWVCGGTDSTKAWGQYFEFPCKEGKFKIIAPVFQKGITECVDPDGIYEYNLIDFSVFKTCVEEAIQSAYDDYFEGKKVARKTITKNKAEIEELREKQKECTEENEYAFNRWEERIQELKEDNEELNECILSDGSDDYDYSHARGVKKMLQTMEKYLKEDKYYVIPYYSF